MSQPYIGEIRIFAGNFAPVGWALCDGQIMAISQNDALFNLIGTTYGGDGQTTFALPDLQGRVPLHMGGGFVLADRGGQETVTLTPAQMPRHSHQATGGTGGNGLGPGGNFWSTDAGGAVASYNTTATGGASMAASAIGNAGGTQPHENMQPCQALTFIIALFGIFPSQ